MGVLYIIPLYAIVHRINSDSIPLPATSKTYFSLLDGMRFFAAFWVMNYHYLSLLGLSTALTWYRYGNLGVQLFFIISGFVIVQSLNSKTLGEFARGRFVRLFPLFWIMCTVTYILPYLVPHTATLNFKQYLISMTMLGDSINGLFHSNGLIDPSYWTLNVEIIFYAAIALFVCAFSYKHIRYFLLSWFAISALSFIFHIDQNFFIKLLLVRHASYFIFGGSLALIATRQAVSVYERYIDRGLAVASAVYSVAVCSLAIPAYITVNPWDAVIVPVILSVFFITIPLLVYLSPKIKNKKVIGGLTILGGITYPLYLLHQKIGNMTINYVTNKFSIPWNIFAIFFELVIIVAAYYIYKEDKELRVWLLRK